MPMPADAAVDHLRLPPAGPASAHIRAALSETLARRAAACDGALRRQLETRLAALATAEHAELAAPRDPAAGRQAEAGPTAAGEGGAAAGPLAVLLDRLAAGRAADDGYPELPALEEFRRLREALRARRQLSQALAPAALAVGPLNSAALARRAVALMQAASPGYLRHFIEYADVLGWLERMHDAGALPRADQAPRGTPVKKAPRRGVRRR